MVVEYYRIKLLPHVFCTWNCFIENPRILILLETRKLSLFSEIFHFLDIKLFSRIWFLLGTGELHYLETGRLPLFFEIFHLVLMKLLSGIWSIILWNMPTLANWCPWCEVPFSRFHSYSSFWTWEVAIILWNIPLTAYEIFIKNRGYGWNRGTPSFFEIFPPHQQIGVPYVKL